MHCEEVYSRHHAPQHFWEGQHLWIIHMEIFFSRLISNQVKELLLLLAVVEMKIITTTFHMLSLGEAHELNWSQERNIEASLPTRARARAL